MQIERLVVVLEGNVAQLRRELAQGNVALRQTEMAAGKTQAAVGRITASSKTAAPSIAAFRGALTALVASTLKLPGPLANVTSLLSTLALGSGATVAIVGGIALIAGGYRLLTADAREAAKAQKELQERLEALSQKRALGIAGPSLLDVEAQEKVVGDLQAKIAHLTRPSRAGRMNEGGREQVAELRAQLATQEKLLLDAQAELQESLNEQTARGLEAELNEVTSGLRAQEAARKDANARMLKDLEEHFKEMIRVVGRGARTALAQVELLATGGRLESRILERQPHSGAGSDARNGLAEAAAAANRRILGNIPETLTPQAVNRFKDAVEKFRDGVKSFFEGFKDFGAIGTQVAAAGVNFLAGKLFEDLRGALESDNSATDRLTAALEKNTAALSVSSEFLRARFGAAVSAAGLDPAALKGVRETIQNVLDRVLVGDIKGDPFGGLAGDTLNEAIRSALAAGGVSPEVLAAIAKGLGLDLDVLSPEVLGQMLDGFAKAGVAATDLAQAFGEVLRNVPEGFKATLDYLRFRGADAVGLGMGTPAAAGGGAGGGFGRPAAANGASFPNATINVYGVQNVKQLLTELEKEALALASRGGAVTIQPAYLRR